MKFFLGSLLIIPLLLLADIGIYTPGRGGSGGSGTAGAITNSKPHSGVLTRSSTTTTNSTNFTRTFQMFSAATETNLNASGSRIIITNDGYYDLSLNVIYRSAVNQPGYRTNYFGITTNAATLGTNFTDIYGPSYGLASNAVYNSWFGRGLVYLVSNTVVGVGYYSAPAPPTNDLAVENISLMATLIPGTFNGTASAGGGNFILTSSGKGTNTYLTNAHINGGVISNVVYIHGNPYFTGNATNAGEWYTDELWSLSTGDRIYDATIGGVSSNRLNFAEDSVWNYVAFYGGTYEGSGPAFILEDQEINGEIFAPMKLLRRLYVTNNVYISTNLWVGGNQTNLGQTIFQDNVFFYGDRFRNSGASWTSILIVTNEALLYGVTTSSGTSVFSGVIRIPAIATNTVPFMDGTSNLVGLTLGANLSVVGGALVAGTGSSGPHYTGSTFKKPTFALHGAASSKGQLWGTNQSWRLPMTSNTTIEVASVLTNDITYRLTITNSTFIPSWSGTINWTDGAYKWDAPLCQYGEYVIDIWIDPVSGNTNAAVRIGPLPTLNLLAAYSQNTNYTIVAGSDEFYINGANDVRIWGVVNVLTNAPRYWSVTITNGSGSPTSLYFANTTNNFQVAGTYGTNRVIVITNQTKILVVGRNDNTNSEVGYQSYPWPQ
jgi:hypothetical protein